MNRTRVAAVLVGMAALTLTDMAFPSTIRFPEDRPWSGGAADGLVVVDGALELAPGRVEGSFEGPRLTTDRRCDRIVPFWNATTPAGSRLQIWARPLDRGEPLADWILVATWSRTVRGPRGRPSGGVTLDQDTLLVPGGADGVQLRAVLGAVPRAAGDRTGAGGTARLRRLGATLFSSRQQPSDRLLAPVDRAVELAVPFRSQRAVDRSIAMKVCGPTSLAMALEHHGIVLPTERVAALARDPEGTIEFGNWAYLAATAAELGLAAEVVALPGVDALVRRLEAGELAILSLTYREGTLRRAPMAATSGHLVLARGFDADGHIRVNDPAGRTAPEGRVRYARKELARAWRNGIAVVVARPAAPDR